MKKTIFGILFLTLLLALPACNRDASKENSSKQEKTEKKTSSKKKKKEKKEKKKEEEGQSEEDTIETYENEYGEIIGDGKLTKVSVEEEEILNDKGFIVRLKKLKIKDYYGPLLYLEVENNTKKRVYVQLEKVWVNGYSSSPSMSIDVPPRETVTDAMMFSLTEMEDCGIETITDIEFMFYIFDQNASVQVLLSDLIHIQTDMAEDYEQIYDDSGEVVYDKNGLRIISKKLEEDRLYGPEHLFYIENDSDTDFHLMAPETYVNGVLLPSALFADVPAGKRSLEYLSLYNVDLEENGIEKIESIEVPFTIYEADKEDPLEVTEPLSISF